MASEKILNLDPTDRRALLFFGCVLALVWLMPNRTFGPYDVLNPRNVWWMLVLVLAIQVAGHLLLRRFGPSAGMTLTGALGGLISSTAVTFTLARRSASATADFARLAALGIAVATCISLLRVPLELTIVAPGATIELSGALALLFVSTLVAPFVLLRGASATDPRQADIGELNHATQIGTAASFALLYAVVLLLTAATNERVGHLGLVPIAAVSGFTDLDAITLSTANLLAQGRIELDTGRRLVAVAVLANVVFKGAVAAVLSRPMRRLLPILCLPTSLTCLALALW